MIRKRTIAALLCIAFSTAVSAFGVSYHLDSKGGDDGNDGLSPRTAWKTLHRASRAEFAPGDRLLLRRNRVFEGQLELSIQGSAQQPIVVDAYGDGTASLPVIDAKGYRAGIFLANCSYLEIGNVEITADGGAVKEEAARTRRYGVYATADGKRRLAHIHLKNLYIHDIFATEQKGELRTRGKNASSNMGMGVMFQSFQEGTFVDILVEDCRIERTGHTGIILRGSGAASAPPIHDVRVLGNRLKMIGGPGIQPSRVTDMIVRRNVVDHSGASSDPRMHGRGSGIWPWSSRNVLIENNRFMHARGRADSCGVHIDFNCRDVVVQYNLSVDNEGGFVEVLGNNHNCAYRYNISINDGFRTKGLNGASHEGKILWLSGYVGRQNPPEGPFNTYIYNNTIYVKPKSRSCFWLQPTADGVLIANNIFHILGDTRNAARTRKDRKSAVTGPQRIVFKNNLYVRESTLPADLPVRDSRPLAGDAGFTNPGGFEPEDFTPRNAAIVRDKGIPIEKLPDDEVGLRIGLKVEKDFFGNPVDHCPDMGAIEMQD